MEGEILKKAMDWFNKAVTFDLQGKDKESLMNKCLDKAISLEKEGIAAGESWNK